MPGSQVHLPRRPDAGSIIVIVATTRRSMLACCMRWPNVRHSVLRRTGWTSTVASGDLFFELQHDEALTPRDLGKRSVLLEQDEDRIDAMYTATADAVESAVYDALWNARTMVGRDGITFYGLPHDRVRACSRDIDARGDSRATQDAAPIAELPAPEATLGNTAAARTGLRRVPNGSPHRAGRARTAPHAARTGPPNRRRSRRRRDRGASARDSRRRLVDGRDRRNVSILHRGAENLCDHPIFTGYDVDGGYAEFALAREDFTYALPQTLDDVHVAPLLCAGIIGFRSLRVAGVERGERVGLYGFGASAHLMLPVLREWKCEIYVATRGEEHRALARSMGADWVGDATAMPPRLLDRAVTFAPSGDVVVAALGALRKGGVVAINAIHLDRMPEFDYDRLLWGERQIRSVANMTRQDARDFLALADRIGLRPHATTFKLDEANEALAKVRGDDVSGAAVIVP